MTKLKIKHDTTTYQIPIHIERPCPDCKKLDCMCYEDAVE